MRIQVEIECHGIELTVVVKYHSPGCWDIMNITTGGDIHQMLKAFSEGDPWDSYDEFIATVDEQVTGAVNLLGVA